MKTTFSKECSFSCERLYQIFNLPIFESKIGHQFENRFYLVEALLHSSYIHENKKDLGQLCSFERLEFLGDSILGAIITTELFRRYPEMSEGNLSKFRGALINEESIGKLALLINLPEYLMVGKGERKTDSLVRTGIISDAFEAVIGAIYLDAGFEKANGVLLSLCSMMGDKFFEDGQLESFDAKSKLQELTMALYKTRPSYEAISTDGGATFQVKILLNGRVLLETTNVSKKKAERELAQKVIEQKLYEK